LAIALPAVALTALLVLAVWLRFSPDRGSEPAGVVAGEGPPRDPAQSAIRRATRPAIQAPPRSAAAAEPLLADDGLPIMPPGPNDPRPDGPVHPHPITPDHRRIFRENDIIRQLSDAMDVEDPAKLHALVKQYREEFPEDGNRLQGGYELIANCLEHPDGSFKPAAQQYFDGELASTIRRFVKRYCLDRGSSQKP
jgi:hypothetical protein